MGILGVARRKEGGEEGNRFWGELEKQVEELILVVIAMKGNLEKI